MNVINKIQGQVVSNDKNLHKSNMILLMKYILYEKNYYNILHKNSLRDFGSYLYISNISDEEKSEHMMYLLNMYCKSYYVFYVKILKNNIVIKFRVSNIEYVIDHIINEKYFLYYGS